MFLDLATLAIENPIDGVLPDFSVFGAEFDAWWKKLFAGFWGLAIVAAIFYLIGGIVDANRHKGGGHPNQVREATQQAKMAGISLGALAALPVLVGAILFVVS